MTKIKLKLVAGLSLLASSTTCQPNSLSPAPMVGALTREQVEKSYYQQFSDVPPVTPDPDVIRLLAEVPRGAEVAIYFGVWCSDSIRELAHLWRALDLLPKPPPFNIRYIGVDRQKQAPGLPPDLNLKLVPTFVVSRAGQELGRVIESAPRGIEIELLELLKPSKSKNFPRG